ncbi:hypothetical protein E2C01_081019 [Portunus trituberculatus]|uniref:Uncharacterized protein n=1 Tax=Portunus trituberculatus TaxID=210409 RepID=A0A5B7IL52_PORTR|nr:hypothetical protein [Portunus trituberculatus]
MAKQPTDMLDSFAKVGCHPGLAHPWLVISLAAAAAQSPADPIPHRQLQWTGKRGLALATMVLATCLLAYQHEDTKENPRKRMAKAEQDLEKKKVVSH